MSSSLDQFVDVAIHQLKDERQPSCGLVKQHLVQLDNVRVRAQSPQGLNFAQRVDLLDGLKDVLHALDGHKL